MMYSLTCQYTGLLFLFGYHYYRLINYNIELYSSMVDARAYPPRADDDTELDASL